MDGDDPEALLKTVLGGFARKRPEKSAQSASLSARTRDAWLRTDACLEHETNGVDEIDHERLARTLCALQGYVQYNSRQESDLVSAPHEVQAPASQPQTSCC